MKMASRLNFGGRGISMRTGRLTPGRRGGGGRSKKKLKPGWTKRRVKRQR